MQLSLQLLWNFPQFLSHLVPCPLNLLCHSCLILGHTYYNLWLEIIFPNEFWTPPSVFHSIFLLVSFQVTYKTMPVDSQPNQWFLVSPLPDFLILGICNFHLLPSPATVDIYLLSPSLSVDLHNFLCIALLSLQEKRKKSTAYWAPNVF